MRRVSASLGGLALATGLVVTPAAAAPSSHISDTVWDALCELESDAGVVFFEVFESEAFGSGALLSFREGAAGPEDDPTWISIDGSAAFTETSVTATFQVVEFTGNFEDPFGDPVGTASLEAALVPVGDPEPYSVSGGGGGNQQFRREGVFQQYTLDGSLELPMGITFSLTAESSCAAFRDTFTQFSNSPASSVFHGSNFDLFCNWQVGDTSVNLFTTAFEFGTETQLSVFVGEELALFGIPTSEPVLTSMAYSVSFDVFEPTEGELEDPVGSADASATLTRAGRINDRFSDGRFKAHFVGSTFTVDGTLSLDAPDLTVELPMDEESCFAADVRSFEQQRSAPKGKPIPNDAPADALPIGVGDTVTVSTGHTDLEPEEPCADEFGGFPIQHTAWWFFEGTGGDVTVDTAGSDFDTIVGVYIEEGGELVSIGCVDDVDSLQARITVATEAGVTYWIQAGGFFGDAGTLVLSVAE